MNATPGLTFACPLCHGSLEADASGELQCGKDHLKYLQADGIWHFMLPDRMEQYRQFIHEYETIRQAEGRGSGSAVYYHSLPYRDLTGRMSADWHIRSISYDAFLKYVLTAMEEKGERNLSVLDLGAGNCWLSHRLSRRGHLVAAVDLCTNDFDGLGCHRYYNSSFTPVLAEFDHLPFPSTAIDLVIFNASLHYSTDFQITLSESLRVLRPTGRLVVLDSPIYRDPKSGAQMVSERETAFLTQYGFRSSSLPSQNYLTYSQLNKLEDALGLQWKIITPNYGLKWALRPLSAAVLHRREPAKFHVLIGNPLQ